MKWRSKLLIILDKWCCMLSRWTPWEFFDANPQVINPQNKGIYSFFSFDGLINKIIQDRLPQDVFEGGKIKVMMGKEITPSWLEDTFCGLTLFGGNESYLVHNANELSSSSQEYLLNTSIDWSGRFFILVFQKDTTFRKELIKKKIGTHVTIQGPPFWHIGKLLDFLADVYKVRLSYESKAYILSAIDNDCTSFAMALNILALNYPDQIQVEIDQVKTLLKATRLNQFALASLLGSRRFTKFYEQLLQVDCSSEDLLKFSFFIKSHLAKLLDPSYINQKNRPSKYDKEIMQHAKLWERQQLLEQLQLWDKWEILLKSSSSSKQGNNPLFAILNQFRRKYLESLA